MIFERRVEISKNINWKELTPHNARARGPRPRLIFCFNYPSGHSTNIETQNEFLACISTHNGIDRKKNLCSIDKYYLPNNRSFISLAAWIPSSFKFFSICLLLCRAALSSADIAQPMMANFIFFFSEMVI